MTEPVSNPYKLSRTGFKYENIWGSYNEQRI